MSHNLLNQECEATKAANDGRKGWFQTPCTCPVAEEKHGCTRNHQHYIGCAGPVRIPQPTSDWEEALQIEVMEDYVIDIQDGFAIQQRGTDTEYAESCKKMQGHFEKLKAFIRKVEADARTNEREALLTALKAVLGEKRHSIAKDSPIITGVVMGFNELHYTLTRFIKEQKEI